MSLLPTIATTDLTLADVPGPAADLDAIIRFGHTFNGYEALGHKACADVANERRHGTLDELRACLFFECRRWRHFGDGPEGEDLAYLRELVRLIRAKVEQRSAGVGMPAAAGQQQEEDGEERSPEELRQRAHILKRLTSLKRARFGSKDFWQGCEEVEIATAEGFQVVSVQDGTPPSKLRASELAMLVDDPTPWEELETDELVEWAEKLGLSTEPRSRGKARG